MPTAVGDDDDDDDDDDDLMIRHVPHDVGNNGLRRFPGCCGGVLDDCSRRARYAGADYLNGLRYGSKTLSASLFMMFATLFSTVALGALVENATHKRIGLSEYLLANSLAGMAHALLGVQPLLVLRPTGPITAITIKLSAAADHFELDFFALLAATGACVGVLMSVIAATELSRHIAHLTPFTHEIFACFVCSIYIVDGVSELMHARATGPDGVESLEDFGLWLLTVCLALMTFSASAALHHARSWTILPAQLRAIIADYNVTLAVILTTAVSYSGSAKVDHWIERIELPMEISPTCHFEPHSASAAASASTPGGVALLPTTRLSHRLCVGVSSAIEGDHRPWMASLSGPSSDTTLWLIALASAIPITFFFYMDQNISSLLCQQPVPRLKHGHYFHASFLWMGVLNVIGPAFGLPFVTGSLPHSPQFVRALTCSLHSPTRGSASADTKTSGTRSPIIKVAENRIAPFLTYAMLGLPLLFPPLLEVIPRAAINGVLAYVGVEGILSTTLWQRALLLITPPASFPPRLLRLSLPRVHTYTLMQLALLACCWLINLSPLGLCVAFLIVALVPLRVTLLPKFFTSDELAVLDAETAADTADADAGDTH